MPTANVGALVGREGEVELLAVLLECVRRGATETVVIEGEAGIGKSRLLAGLADAAGDLDVTVLRGSGHRPFAGELTSETPGYGAEYVFYAAAFVAEVAGQPEAGSSTCVVSGSTTPCVITATATVSSPRR